MPSVPAPPDQIDLERHRDLVGRNSSVWFRRALVLVLVAVVAVALANGFGQHPTSSRAAGGGASLTVNSPTRLRGGLLYQVRITMRSPTVLRDAHLVLSPGWLQGMTLNTLEPSPSQETSANGSLALSLGRIPAGHEYVQFLDFQVNPTTVTRRSVTASLFDGATRLTTLHRTITVFP